MPLNTNVADSGNLGYRIISLAQSAETRDLFKKNVCMLLCEEYECRETSIVIREGELSVMWKAERKSEGGYEFRKTLDDSRDPGGGDPAHPRGSWSSSFEIDDRTKGTIALTPIAGRVIGDVDGGFFSDVVGIFGRAIHFRRSQDALKERVKEITCFYDISKIMNRSQDDFDDTLVKVIEVIPEAFQYPAHAEACIQLDGRTYGCRGSIELSQPLTSGIVIAGRERGLLGVWYRDALDTAEDREFLREEQELLDGIAAQLSLLIEEREAALEKRKLEEQLRHADRLATLGQLTAGVAHDINEPLANILGFAELLRKNEDLSDQSRRDLDKIIHSSMYARDIVRKLLVFTGKITPGITSFDLNEIIEESLRFFEARCRNKAIDIVAELASEPLYITADPGHLHQVMANLLVNSIQALPEGGRIKITSRAEGPDVVFSIEDDGMGIDNDQKESIFVPFYTTKERGVGTGLGLSTVLGIVTTYKGEISVESEPKVYTRFTVRFPGTAGIDE